MTGRVVERARERVRVTMEWVVDADLETTDGGRVRVEGWPADMDAIFAACTPDKARMVRVERTGGDL